MTPPIDDLSDIERAAEAATPGPWCQHPNGTSVWRGPDWDTVNHGTPLDCPHVCNAPSVCARSVDDTHFIALANPARLLALVSEVRGLRAKVAGLEAGPTDIDDPASIRRAQVRSLL